MYDIKIFLEDNWYFWARLSIWKEIIYVVWKDYIDLMIKIKKELDFCYDWKIKNNNEEKLFNFFNKVDNNNILCQ